MWGRVESGSSVVSVGCRVQPGSVGVELERARTFIAWLVRRAGQEQHLEHQWMIRAL